MRKLLGRLRATLGETVTSTAGVTAVTVVSKILGFVKNALFAALFGATAQTDMFYMASSIYQMFAGFFGSIQEIIVPIRTRMLAEREKESADRLVSTVIVVFSGAALLCAVMVFLFPGAILKVFAPGYTQEEVAGTTTMLRMLTPLMAVSCASGFFGALLNAHKRFLLNAAGGLVINVVGIVVGLIFAETMGESAMVLCVIVGTVANVALQIVGLTRHYRFTFRIDLRDPALRSALLLWLPVALGSLVGMINQTVDKALASLLDAGSVTAMNYSMQLMSLASGILTGPLIAVLYTSLSQRAQEEDTEGLKAIFGRALSTLTVVLAPVVLFCVFFADEIVTIVYARGAFDAQAVTVTSRAFLFYCGLILTGGANALLMRTFYALHNTRVPMVTSAIQIAINIIVSIALVSSMGVAGLALGTVVAGGCSILIRMIVLRRRIGPLGLLAIARDMFKVLCGFLPIALISFAVKRFLGLSPLFSFAAAVLAGGGLYVAVLALLRQRDVVDLLTRLRGFLRRREGGSD